MAAEESSDVGAPTPTVDVIIAARNEARYLGACLESLAAQDYPSQAVQVFVVDDGSTDATCEIAESFPADRLHVRLLRQAGRGAAAARNNGISAGDGELLALLDAHCLIEPGWMRALVAHFANAVVGGCQGRMDSRATSPRVQRYLTRSGAQSNERILDDTVSGKRNLYPWILSGNSMYRRTAVEEAGGFDESLRACEDVDLAWRVILRGYHLAYEPDALAVHYDTNSWSRFVRKGLTYGAGAAELTTAYQAHGARNKFAPTTVWRESLDSSLSALCYAIGYRIKNVRLRLGVDRPPAPRPPVPIDPRFRPWIAWTMESRLRVGEATVYWFREGARPESVVVHIPSRTRLVLEGAGDFFWRKLVQAQPRDDIVAETSTYYGISPVTARADLDDFVEELAAGGFIDREQV